MPQLVSVSGLKEQKAQRRCGGQVTGCEPRVHGSHCWQTWPRLSCRPPGGGPRHWLRITVREPDQAMTAGNHRKSHLNLSPGLTRRKHPHVGFGLGTAHYQDLLRLLARWITYCREAFQAPCILPCLNQSIRVVVELFRSQESRIDVIMQHSSTPLEGFVFEQTRVNCKGDFAGKSGW